MKLLLTSIAFLLLSTTVRSQSPSLSKAWVADRGDGTYRNPVLHADYSDPDAIRVGDDFYMTASSFEDVPGLPILHSRDLVNWTLVGHALKTLTPAAHFSVPRHGGGVWAPSIRYHKGEYYIYYPDPDFGIYLVKTKDPKGDWSKPQLVMEGKGLIDPCPLWDDDGRVYLVHAYAGSRAGIKSVLAITELNAEGTAALKESVLVYDGHQLDPTIEGPKLYKRQGFYYIFAPAGGVATGWQTVLRSKNIYGPYERRVVMSEGRSGINGPHQGAWVNTTSGEDWFLHFQDKEAYGRVVHLQPMVWKDGWPLIGVDPDGDGIGEPVLTYRKPAVQKRQAPATPPDADEFNSSSLGKQWQWMSNPKGHWYFVHPAQGVLRLYAQPLPDSARNLWGAGHVLQQKFPAEQFVVTTALHFKPNSKLDERAGVTVMGLSYAGVGVRSNKGKGSIVFFSCTDAEKGGEEKQVSLASWSEGPLYLKIEVSSSALCRFYYSTDGNRFIEAVSFKAEPGRWKGAKIGLFCERTGTTNDAGFADFDWFRVSAKPKE